MSSFLWAHSCGKAAWRDEGELWAESVTCFSKGVDHKAQELASSLGLSLYRSLDLPKKELIKRTMRSGYIVLKSNIVQGVESQRKLINQIV